MILEDETLRDGLQAEAKILGTEDKVELFELLVAAGLRRIQVGSFAHPKLVPQMADTKELIGGVKHTPNVLLTGLILNHIGLERALDSGLGHVSMSVSLSNTHSRKNVGRPADEALKAMTELITHAVASGIAVRAGVQCAFGCVYEGTVPEERVLRALETMAHAGATELNLADTTGMANPVQTRRLIAQVKDAFPRHSLSLHLHDTRGLGIANMVAGYEVGVEIFDVTVGGFGGCPFVKGAAGNVPTEDAVNLFEQMGVETGISIVGLCRVHEKLEKLLGRSLPGRMCRVLRETGSYA